MKHACHMLSAPKCMVLVTIQLYNHAILSLSLSRKFVLSHSLALSSHSLHFPPAPLGWRSRGAFAKPPSRHACEPCDGAVSGGIQEGLQTKASKG